MHKIINCLWPKRLDPKYFQTLDLSWVSNQQQKIFGICYFSFLWQFFGQKLHLKKGVKRQSLHSLFRNCLSKWQILCPFEKKFEKKSSTLQTFLYSFCFCYNRKNMKKLVGTLILLNFVIFTLMEARLIKPWTERGFPIYQVQKSEVSFSIHILLGIFCN